MPGICWAEPYQLLELPRADFCFLCSVEVPSSARGFFTAGEKACVLP